MDAIETLIAQGHAFIDSHGNLVGIASDGVEVNLQFFAR